MCVRTIDDVDTRPGSLDDPGGTVGLRAPGRSGLGGWTGRSEQVEPAVALLQPYLADSSANGQRDFAGVPLEVAREIVAQLERCPVGSVGTDGTGRPAGCDVVAMGERFESRVSVCGHVRVEGRDERIEFTAIHVAADGLTVEHQELIEQTGIACGATCWYEPGPDENRWVFFWQ